jgi:prepilin-type N-terminal cleavage/methylation domain-containing protein
MTRTCTAWTLRRRDPERRRPAGARGFTLIELLVTIAIIGMAVTVVATGSRTLLPQARLRATAENLASALERARTYAVLHQEPMLFAYDIERGGYEAFVPYERDEEGENIGPGHTTILEWTGLEEGIALRGVRLPGGALRDRDVVTVAISALGRIVPHEVVVHNPQYPDTEVLTLRVSGIVLRSEILRGDVVMEPVTDADFR